MTVSNDAAVPGVEGDNTDSGTGVLGQSAGGTGVHGWSLDGFGVYGEATGAGRGVVASSVGGYGLRAGSTNSSAIRASSINGVGIEAAGCTSGIVPAGALPEATDGVVGTSPTGNGVRGESTSPAAAGGHFEGWFEGVHAVSHHKSAAGIAGYNDSSGPGIFGKSTSGPAGYFEGSIVVTGDIQLSGNDLAEQFEVADATGVEPGTVMVLDGADRVRVSESAYDRRVVGVLAGAGSYRPGVVLDHHAEASNRQALALVGKAYCKVDASASPVEVGDLLTTSSTRGHAMKASESDRAFGAVLGKAMASLTHGRGVLPILVALQ